MQEVWTAKKRSPLCCLPIVAHISITNLSVVLIIFIYVLYYIAVMYVPYPCKDCKHTFMIANHVQYQ